MLLARCNSASKGDTFSVEFEADDDPVSSELEISERGDELNTSKLELPLSEDMDEEAVEEGEE